MKIIVKKLNGDQVEMDFEKLLKIHSVRLLKGFRADVYETESKSIVVHFKRSGDHILKCDWYKEISQKEFDEIYKDLD